MQVQFKLTVGENEFTLVDEVESHSDFFKKMSFYSTLPKVGPNGETDLVIQHRRAQDKYDYYSIVSKKADMEFKFGQSTVQGQLFAKGWEPLYKGDGSESDEANVSDQSSGSSGGLGAPTLANLDADADLELVAGTSQSGVVAWDLPGSANARVLWSTGRGSLRRSGQALRADLIFADGFD